MKKIIFKGESRPYIEREKLKALYMNNIYNIFMTSHKWTGLSYQQENYIMRKLWANGSVALYPLKHFEDEANTYDRFILATFAPCTFNIYDYPIDINLINTRGVKFIPNKRLKVDKDVIITYIQPSKKSLASFVEIYVDKIVNVEMILQIALNAQKLPYLIRISEENRQEMDQLWRSLQSDEPKLFISGDYDKDITALVTGAPYIVDKLYNLKACLWNDLLTFIGVNNLGINEKKEHLVSNEIEANNDYVEASGNCITSLLRDFCERANKVFGYSLGVISLAEEKQKQAARQAASQDQEEQDNQDESEVTNND